MPDSTETSTFGALLRRHRLAAGWTQATLGERAGIAERTIQDLERGAARPRRTTARRLAAALALLPEARCELEAVTPTPRDRVPGTREAETDGRPNNLRVQPTTLIGRGREVDEVRTLLQGSARLVTLTGPGGVGKTRLSVEVAAELLNDFADGVFLVELAPISDPALVPSSIAQVLGVRDLGEGTLLESLRAFLRSRSVLLMLDNFEQIVMAATVVAELLASSPGLKVLVTSREPLHLRGEQEYNVLPLALPNAHQRPSSELLTGYAAIALFVERAAAVQVDFAMTEDTSAAIAEVCARLDGLPLAIELAAARVRLLTPQMMADRLERRLQFVIGGPRDLPNRQQTLRNMIAWSHELLDEHERRLFRRLSAFVGGWTVEAAEAVCGLDDPGDLDCNLLDGLGSLISKNLIRRGEDLDGETRFGMLETIREYALERLEASGEAAELRRRHAMYWLEHVEAAEPELTGPRQATWLSRLEAEHDNLRAALRWTVEQGEAELGLRLGGSLWQFWDVRGHLTEGRARLGDALAAAGLARRTPALAKARLKLGNVAWAQGDFTAARVHYEESLTIQRELADSRGIADSLNNLGNVEWDQGEYAAARTHYEESLAIRREMVDSRGIADSLHNLADVEVDQGEYAAARAHYEESLAIRREMRDSGRIAYSLNNLGTLNLAQGEYAAARTLLEQALAIRRELGERAGIADSLNCLGNVVRVQGDFAAARVHYEQSLTIQRELADRRGIADVLQNLGSVARAQADDAGARALFEESLAIRRELGDRRGIAETLESCATLPLWGGPPKTRAARLLGAAEALRMAIGAPLSPGERAHYDGLLASVRGVLSEEGFAAAWAEGRAMSVEQAVAYALDFEKSST